MCQYSTHVAPHDVDHTFCIAKVYYCRCFLFALSLGKRMGVSWEGLQSRCFTLFIYLFVCLFSRSCFLNVHPGQRMAIYCLDYPVVMKITL